MPEPSKVETSALEEAWQMLRFAATNQSGIDQSIISAIFNAENAMATKDWTEETSKLFWPAYIALGGLIRPVTVDCLTASRRDRTLFNSFNWRRRKDRNAGEITSQYYIMLLIVVLLATIVTQFYVTRYSSIVANIDAAGKVIQAEYLQLNSDDAALNAETANLGSTAWTQAEIDASSQVTNEAHQVDDQAADLAETKVYLDTITIIPFGFGRKSEVAIASSQLANLPIDWSTEYNIAVENARTTLTLVNTVDQKADSESSGIYVFCLPILYASIGAIAYILRSISAQLQTTTFSLNSPIRHAVRLGLGVMMGLIVGAFSGITGELNLQPLAIAFLAGYGVEVFFSSFDSLIDRFKPQPAAKADPRGEVVPPGS